MQEGFFILYIIHMRWEKYDAAVREYDLTFLSNYSTQIGLPLIGLLTIVWLMLELSSL